MIRRTAALAFLVLLAFFGAGAAAASAQTCEVANCPPADAAPLPPVPARAGPLPSGSAVVEGTPPATDQGRLTSPLGATSGPTANGLAAALAGVGVVSLMLFLLTRLRHRQLTVRAPVRVVRPAPTVNEAIDEPAREPEDEPVRQRVSTRVSEPAVLDSARR